MTRFCKNCNQTVVAKRKIGVGTFILAVVTSGFSLLCIPFYSKRCPMCQGTHWGKKNDDEEKEAA